MIAIFARLPSLYLFTSMITVGYAPRQTCLFGNQRTQGSWIQSVQVNYERRLFRHRRPFEDPLLSALSSAGMHSQFAGMNQCSHTGVTRLLVWSVSCTARVLEWTQRERLHRSSLILHLETTKLFSVTHCTACVGWRNCSRSNITNPGVLLIFSVWCRRIDMHRALSCDRPRQHIQDEVMVNDGLAFLESFFRLWTTQSALHHLSQ